MSYERILVADDDKDIRNLVERYLQREGYQVRKAESGDKALIMTEQYDFDLVILDIMMPGMDGFEALSRIRKRSDIPVIFLSARGDEPDKIIGLGLGADDYITKPFSAGELIARVKAHLRRYGAKFGLEDKNTGSSRQFGDLVIDLEARQATISKKTVELTKTEFDILELLSSTPGRVYTFEQIYTSVWEEDFLGNPNIIMVHIKKIREKLGDAPKNPIYIQTVWGVGYKFIG